jgi:hypothetical protein
MRDGEGHLLQNRIAIPSSRFLINFVLHMSAQSLTLNFRPR